MILRIRIYWGELYISPYTGRVLTRAAFTFGTRVGKFAEACEKMGAGSTVFSFSMAIRYEFMRQNAPGVYGSDPLWLDREPTVEEVEQSLSGWDLNAMDEVVFCGYGEPTERLKDLLEVAAWIKKNYTVKTRINTNGLADLIWGEPTESWLAGKIDAISVSLNAIDKEEFLRLTRSKFGIGSYDAMLAFTKEAAKYVPNVMMTVVDQVTSPEEQEAARKICESLGVKLRVRPFES